MYLKIYDGKWTVSANSLSALEQKNLFMVTLRFTIVATKERGKEGMVKASHNNPKAKTIE